MSRKHAYTMIPDYCHKLLGLYYSVLGGKLLFLLLFQSSLELYIFTYKLHRLRSRHIKSLASSNCWSCFQ